jgi:DnaJ-class molecular chaperone
VTTEEKAKKLNELEEMFLELLEPADCKPCGGNGKYEDYNKKSGYFMRECSACEGSGKVPSYFAEEVARRLQGDYYD